MIIGLVGTGLTCGVALAYYVGTGGTPLPETDDESPQWASIAQVNPANLTTVGKNAYFNLEPGYRLEYADGPSTRTVTVRRKTKLVDGVQTRVVEEKEQRGGQPTKVLWKYYAIDKESKALYCFGVHVQNYYEGKVVSHDGWRSGVHGAVFRLAMPAAPKVGDTLVQRHGRTRYEVIGVGEKVTTPAGQFSNCFRTQVKGTAEDEGREKVFAPGVGLVKDGQFSLVKIVQTTPSRSVASSY
ncbi:MAG: hypothetical protein ABSF26_02365 [Thermoguttaceae bacterium]